MRLEIPDSHLVERFISCFEPENSQLILENCRQFWLSEGQSAFGSIYFLNHHDLALEISFRNHGIMDQGFLIPYQKNVLLDCLEGRSSQVVEGRKVSNGLTKYMLLYSPIIHQNRALGVIELGYTKSTSEEFLHQMLFLLCFFGRLYCKSEVAKENSRLKSELLLSEKILLAKLNEMDYLSQQIRGNN